MTIVLNGTTGITNDGGYTGDGVVFADTTPANTLVTTTGGNVGIGTASPGFKLDVSSTARATNWALPDGGFLFWGNGSTAIQGNASTSVLQLLTGGSERARIDSSGNLLVGTTTSAATAGGLSLYNGSSAGRIDFSNISGATRNTCVFYYGATPTVSGSIQTASTSVSYNTSSDYRLKEQVQPMTGALATVAALKPVKYKWKVDGSDGQGFIAHELQAVVPDCVTGEKDEVDAEGNPVYQGIDTSFLVATLTAAIQEQQAIITALTARVAALEGTQNV
jgi:hypothetical protein